MEVVNLKRQIAMGVEILQQVRNCLKVSIHAHDLNSEAEVRWKGSLTYYTRKQLADAETFVGQFAGGAAIAVHRIYTSQHWRSGAHYTPPPIPGPS